MADANNKPSNLKRTLLLVGGGVGLFAIGRYLGRREGDEDLAFLLEECESSEPRVDAQLADTAAHASSLSHQLYEISRRLRSM